jgi:hypothetical protein
MLALGMTPENPGSREAVPPMLEVDHIFILTAPGAQEERTALEAVGLKVSPTVAKHIGSGTASIGVLFANAYLELLWVDGSVPVEPAQAKSADRTRQRAAWRSTCASPFGVGLRRTPSAPDMLPFDAVPYSAPWMQPGTAILILSDDPAGPGLFVVPRYMALDAWVREAHERDPQLFRHAAGAERLTRSIVAGPHRMGPRLPAVVADLPDLRIVEAPEHGLELTFDDGRQGKRVDLRPRLPLVIRF